AYTSIESLLTNLDLKTQDVTKKGIQIPAYRAAQLDELLETKKLYDDTFRRLLRNLKHPEEQLFELPEGLEADLRSYQKIGYQWFKSLSAYHLGGILADDM